jgi:potassium/hydrogen antiporter
MPTRIPEYLTLVGSLLIAAVLLSRASARFGVPVLLAFIGLGMLAGQDGLGRIEFKNYQLSFDLSITALLLILFYGGFNTTLPRVRNGLAPAVILATVGVLGTAGLIGVVVHLMLPLSWTEALLVGAIISPTGRGRGLLRIGKGRIPAQEARRYDAGAGVGFQRSDGRAAGRDAYAQHR